MKDNSILDVSDTNPVVTKLRPTAITVICILGFIGIPLNIIILFVIYDELIAISSTYPIIYPLLMLIGTIGMIGLWKMKKWGYYCYLLMHILSIIYTISINYFDVFSFIITVIIIVTISLYYNKMN